uniref:Uncharacterized protein n=1 Tax=Kalanchoe fedtschenkoi TaxID=63787 RepID=A0A7N0ZYA1_KALFE
MHSSTPIQHNLMQGIQFSNWQRKADTGLTPSAAEHEKGSERCCMIESYF